MTTGVTVFTCGSHRERCSAPGCGATSVQGCQFALGGRRTGQQCGLAVCERHAWEWEGRRMCGAHMNAIKRAARR